MRLMISLCFIFLFLQSSVNELLFDLSLSPENEERKLQGTENIFKS